MHAYLLLDRTGSMQDRWTEALSSVNAYAADLKAKPDAKITLAVFDHHETFQFDLLRRDVSAEKWRDVTDAEATPRGMTPLFDAIGRMVAVAEGDGPDRAVIVIVTDGAENSSREVTKAGAKAALDRAEKRGWQVVFLGANFAEFSDAEAVGVASAKRMAMAPGSMQLAMASLGRKSRGYFESGEEVAFSEADRKEAGEHEVRK